MRQSRLFGWLMAAFMLVTFASCRPAYWMDPVVENDVQESRTLSGEWQGNFGMWYGIDWHGKYQEFDAAYSNVVFYPASRYATYGTGRQVDFYDYGPYAYQYYYFEWEIRNGIIYLTYPSDRSLDADIYDYYMDNRIFDGYFGSSYSYFEMDKLAGFNWSLYCNDYGYGTRSADTRSTDAVSEGEEETEPQVIKRGRRF